MRGRRKSEREKPRTEDPDSGAEALLPNSDGPEPETPAAAAPVAPAGPAESAEAHEPVSAPPAAQGPDAPARAASLAPAAPADSECADTAGEGRETRVGRVNWDDEPAPGRPARLGDHARRYGLYAAGFVLAAGLGWGAGAKLLSGGPDSRAPDPGTVRIAAVPAPQAKPAASPQRASDQDGAARPAVDAVSEVRALKERLERSERELAAKLDAVSDRLDRLSRPESGPKLDQVLERLERIERQVASTSAAAPPASAAVVPAAQPAADKAVSKPTLDGWLVRGVHDGVAWVEGRNGVIHEVGLGQNIPGAGRVEAIQRRGRDWIVVTSRGVIVEE